MMEWIISSCFLILVVLVLGKLLGSRVSARLRYALWLLVLVRLLVPGQLFTLPSELASVKETRVVQSMETESIYVLPINRAPVEEAKEINAHVQPDGTVVIATSMGYGRLEDNGETVVVYMEKLSPREFFAVIWKCGVLAAAALLILSNARFAFQLRKKRKKVDVECLLPVYLAGELTSPCLFGLFSPAIYLTEEIIADERAKNHVLTHEMTHYHHLDHIWSALRCAALAVHWWNPLVWLAVIASKRDGEVACDESALERLGEGERRAYGETLLRLVTARTQPRDVLRCATTMTGGKRSLTQRIKRIARQPKYFLSAAVALVLVSALAAGCSFGRVEQGNNQTHSQTTKINEDEISPGIRKTITMIFNAPADGLYVSQDGDYDVADVLANWTEDLEEYYGEGAIEHLIHEGVLTHFHAKGALYDKEYRFNGYMEAEVSENGEEVKVEYLADGEPFEMTVQFRLDPQGKICDVKYSPVPDLNIVSEPTAGISEDVERIVRLIFDTERSDLYYPVELMEEDAASAVEKVTEVWDAEIGTLLAGDIDRELLYRNNNLFIRYAQHHGSDYELFELNPVQGEGLIEKVDAVYLMDDVEYTTRFRFERNSEGKIVWFMFETNPPVPLAASGEVSDMARRVVEAMFDTKSEELNYLAYFFYHPPVDTDGNGIENVSIDDYMANWEERVGDCFSPGAHLNAHNNCTIIEYHTLEAVGVSIELVDMERTALESYREEVLVTFTANGEENQVTINLRINTDGLFYRIELAPYPYDENLIIGGSWAEEPVQFPIPEGYEISENMIGTYVVEQGYSGDHPFPFGEGVAFILDKMGYVPAEVVTFDTDGYPAEITNGANAAWFVPVQRLENCAVPALLCEYRVYRDKVLYEEDWCYALCFAKEESDRFYCFFFSPVLYDVEKVVDFAPMVTFGENAFPVNVK